MSGPAIDRLILNLPPMSPADARRLALLVAAGLARANGLAGAGEISSLRVVVPPAGAGKPDILADRIIADVLRQIRRAP